MFRNKKFITIIFVIILTFPRIIYCQDYEEITLEKIFIDKEYTAAPAGLSPWVGRSHQYVCTRKSEKYPGSKDILIVDPDNEGDVFIIPAFRLIPKGYNAPLNFISFNIADNMSYVIFTVPVSPKRNDQPNYDYWFFDLSDWYLKKIELDDLKADITDIIVSPDLNYIAFTNASNIYVQNIRSSDRKQLTEDGSQAIINGNSSENFDSVLNMRGFKWSSDSKKLAYAQFDVTNVKEFAIINNTDSLYPSISKLKYVKVGEHLPACKIGVADINSGITNWLDIPGDPGDNYITSFDWKPGSNEVIIHQLNRNQNKMKIFSGIAESGKIKLIYSDHDDAFLNPFELHWVDSNRFLWVSEKNGWRHIYKVSADGKNEKNLINRDFDIEAIQGLDAVDGWVYFTASPDNSIYRFLYRVNINMSDTIEKLTPEEFQGVSSYSVSPDTKFAFHIYSNINTPPVTSMISLPDHQIIQTIEDNKLLRNKLKNINYKPAEFLKIDIGNHIILDAWCIFPPDFNPEMKYPLIFHVYSMPARQLVQDRWLNEDYIWYQMMAHRGFIVMNIDTRGTPALYGRDWRKAIYGKHGILQSDEQAAAVKSLISRWDFIDKDRIGICGWSGGGMVSLMQILRYPDIYKVSIPGAFLSSSRLYQAGFTERFLGLPQDNPEEYKLTEAINYVDGLKGHLLLIHGTGDDNVHYQSTEILINALIKAKKRFFLMPYPNRPHVFTTDDDRYHLYDMYTWFFTTHLLP